MKKKVVKILYSFGFAKRNIEASPLIELLEKEGYIVDTNQDIYRTDSLSRFWSVIKYNLTKRLYYRFGYLNRFKKFVAKYQHRNDNSLNQWDRVNSSLGFPFPGSRVLFNFLQKIYINLPSQIRPDFKADLVILTDFQDLLGQNFIKFNQKARIPTIALNSSWDHLTHRGEVIPSTDINKYLVWNEIQKDEITKIHGVPLSKVEIIGALHFDFLFQEDQEENHILLNQIFGFNSDYKILFLPAYNERHGKQEPAAIQHILKHLGELNNPVKIIIRPYPNDQTFQKRFSKVIDHPDVIVSTLTGKEREDFQMMSTLLKGADIILTGASTAAIEAMFYDKAVIHLGIDSNERKGTQALFKKYFFSDHYQHIMKHGASSFVETYSELFNSVNAYLEKPLLHRSQREMVIQEQVFYKDGKAAERIVNIINDITKKELEIIHP